MAQYIYGRNTVLSALKEKKVKTIYITDNFNFKPINDFLNKNSSILIKNVSKKELDTLTKFANHQGVVAEIDDYKYSQLNDLIEKANKSQYPLLVILDELKDPHNLGAILRCMDAFGADGVIIKKNGQVQVNSTVAKVSTGAIDYVPVCQVTNLVQTIKTLKERGYWIVASDGSAKCDYRDVDYRSPIALVIGSEGEGISRLVLENSDFVTKIPMIGHVNSLNASVATAVYLAQIYSNRFPS